MCPQRAYPARHALVTMGLAGLLATPAGAQDSRFSGEILLAGQTLDADAAQSAMAADLDGDGDLDLVVADSGANRVLWFENADGAGTFVGRNPLTDSAASVRHACPADLDGDGDLVSAREVGHGFAWHENADGQGTIGAPHLLSDDADQACAILAADLNGDGLADAISASTGDGRIAWYRNEGGTGLPGEPQQESRRVAKLLRPAAPNPFNPVVGIPIALADAKPVRLVVHNLRGQEVAVLVDGIVQPGGHTFVFDADPLATGIYTATLKSAGCVETQTITLLL